MFQSAPGNAMQLLSILKNLAKANWHNHFLLQINLEATQNLEAIQNLETTQNPEATQNLKIFQTNNTRLRIQTSFKN